jgi:hypothetical protein
MARRRSKWEEANLLLFVFYEVPPAAVARSANENRRKVQDFEG